MSIATLIIGESGTGKSTALRNLSPERTFLIKAVNKPLPFRAHAGGWKDWHPKTGGNVVTTDNAPEIEKFMRKTQREIIVIDDWQYILANEFMRRSGETGFGKFTDIGRHAWDIVQAASDLASDTRVYILAHSNTDDQGHTKLKTIGKLLDEKITVEGLFTHVLRTKVVDGHYYFATRNNGFDTVKTPMGMFDSDLIENDLAAVDDAICAYYGIGVTPRVAA